MSNQTKINVDLSALVDIISNVAGMMILLACVAVIVQHNMKDGIRTEAGPMKPISFPLAYVPDKRSLTLGIMNNRLFELPEKKLLEAVAEKTRTGEPVQWLTATANGVDGRIELTPTVTGFRFSFKLRPGEGTALASPTDTVAILDRLIKEFPPSRFFYVFHCWSDSFLRFREIREYLLDQGVEVGWTPRTESERDHDIVYSIGEYSDKLATIKAQ